MGEELVSHDISTEHVDLFSADKSRANNETASAVQKDQTLAYLRSLAKLKGDELQDAARPEISGADRVWERIKEGKELSKVTIVRDSEGNVIQVHARVDGSTDDLYFSQDSLQALREFKPEEPNDD